MPLQDRCVYHIPLQNVYKRLDGRYGNCTKSNNNTYNIYHDKYQVTAGLNNIAKNLVLWKKKLHSILFCTVFELS